MIILPRFATVYARGLIFGQGIEACRASAVPCTPRHICTAEQQCRLQGWRQDGDGRGAATPGCERDGWRRREKGRVSVSQASVHPCSIDFLCVEGIMFAALLVLDADAVRAVAARTPLVTPYDANI